MSKKEIIKPKSATEIAPAKIAPLKVNMVPPAKMEMQPKLAAITAERKAKMGQGLIENLKKFAAALELKGEIINDNGKYTYAEGEKKIDLRDGGIYARTTLREIKKGKSAPRPFQKPTMNKITPLSAEEIAAKKETEKTVAPAVPATRVPATVVEPKVETPVNAPKVEIERVEPPIAKKTLPIQHSKSNRTHWTI